MDTTIESDDQTTIESTVPMQNGFTNGIINGTEHQEEQKIVSKSDSQSRGSAVTSISKISAAQGSMLRKDIFYPYQKSMYMSPGYNLSSDSKRMMRRLQEPIFAASPGTVHLVYEVGRLMTEILLKAIALSLCVFWYALCIFFSVFINAIYHI